jgi:hypothetical protein
LEQPEHSYSKALQSVKNTIGRWGSNDPYFQVPRLDGVAAAYQIQVLILLTWNYALKR